MDIIDNIEVITYKSMEHDKYDKSYCYTQKTTVYYVNKLKHRNNDLPALISEGHKVWYQFGKIHRSDDKPAQVCINHNIWYINGKLHRDNGLPAIIANDIPYFIEVNGTLLGCSKVWVEHGNYIRHE